MENIYGKRVQVSTETRGTAGQELSERYLRLLTVSGVHLVDGDYMIAMQEDGDVFIYTTILEADPRYMEWVYPRTELGHIEPGELSCGWASSLATVSIGE